MGDTSITKAEYDKKLEISTSNPITYSYSKTLPFANYYKLELYSNNLKKQHFGSGFLSPLILLNFFVILKLILFKSENTIFYSINFVSSMVFLLLISSFLNGNLTGNLPWIAFPLLIIGLNSFISTFYQILQQQTEVLNRYDPFEGKKLNYNTFSKIINLVGFLLIILSTFFLCLVFLIYQEQQSLSWKMHMNEYLFSFMILF